MRWMILALALLATPAGAQVTQDSVRTELVRSRGFLRAAETQLTKSLDLLDAMVCTAPEPTAPSGSVAYWYRVNLIVGLEDMAWKQMRFDADGSIGDTTRTMTTERLEVVLYDGDVPVACGGVCDGSLPRFTHAIATRYSPGG